MGSFQKITCILLAALLFGGCTTDPAATTVTTAVPTSTAATVPPTTAAPTVPPTTPGPTVPPTTAVQPERFLLSFAGDCTLGENHDEEGNSGTYTRVVGKNYGYPMSNVRHIFEADDFTLVNLECALTSSYPTEEEMVELETHRFRFRGPTDYTNILTGSSIEFASCANNHSRDYGLQGLLDTWDALEDADLAYASFGRPCVATTQSGLTIGVCAIFFGFTQAQIENTVKQLRDKGAEIIIMSIHWGDEGVYLPDQLQQNMGHMAIDAGVDIVYGHHPHVLQRIEEYGDGIIYYSLGNFCFGGNNYPQDLDTAILQQEVIRDLDGSISLGELTIIPASCSSLPVQNNFQPTPYEPGTKEYDRVMSKLDGTYAGPNLPVH